MQDQPVAVLDTNVVLDWLVFGAARVAPLMTSVFAGSTSCIACPWMRDELARQLRSRRLARWAPDPTAALLAYDERVELVAHPSTVTPRGLVCSDADDQVFIDLALERSARWLVTHDRALLCLAARARTHGLAIVTPAAWVR